MMLLVEHLKPAEAQLVESVVDGKNLFLSGRMMVGEQVNGNGRIYPRDEISRAVKYFQTKIDEGNFIAGELNHPDNLTIDLKNVSHIITEIKMDGDVAYGKCKILNTPSGQIAKALIEGGMRLGVSSRGTGNVTNEGLVSDFQPVTVDIVANPSGPGCYPDVLRESKENHKIISLAEAVCQDKTAQKFFQKEMDAFIRSILKR